MKSLVNPQSYRVIFCFTQDHFYFFRLKPYAIEKDCESQLVGIFNTVNRSVRKDLGENSYGTGR